MPRLDRYSCRECGSEIEMTNQTAREGGADFACCRSCGAELDSVADRSSSVPGSSLVSSADGPYGEGVARTR